MRVDHSQTETPSHFSLSDSNKGECNIKHLTNPNQTTLAKNLRRNQSDAERKLWSKLRSSQLDGWKFRRQQPIGIYIVDFVCPDKKLIIEVDGSQHSEEPIVERDNKRTEWLKSVGYSVIRFGDNEVLQNIEGVVYKIRECL